MTDINVNVTINVNQASQETMLSNPEFNSKEQEIYYMSLPELHHLRAKEKSIGLTLAEKEEKDEIICILFDLIKNFGYDTINKMTKECYLKREDRQDLDTLIKLSFMEHLYDYDPMIATPTTFFVKYFIESIRVFLQDCMRVSPYDASNIRKLRAIINQYEANNTPFTELMLANESGLSPKVVKRTLELMSTKTVDIDEFYDLKGDTASPEEAALELEKTQAIYDLIRNELTPAEARLLLLRLNLDEDKRNTYDAVAKLSGMDIHSVRKSLNNIGKKLKESKTFKDHWGGIHYGSKIESPKVPLHRPDTYSIDEDSFLAFLEDIA